MGRNERFVVGLDIGTSAIRCVVVETRQDHSLEIVGLGEASSRGLRKGVVVNLDATVEAIKSAVDKAELMAGVPIDSATVGIAGAHIRSFNSRGVVSVSAKDRTVSKEDVARVMDAAQAVSIPADREILHVLPQEFVLDDQSGITAPVGMVGSRLEANVHIVTASNTSVQNLVSCANRAGIEVRDTVLEQLAVAESVLSEDERELGVAMVDIGGGTTDLAIFERGAIWHTAVLPVGGDHFTNDLAVGLRTPIPDAEKLKRKHGCSLVSMANAEESIEVPSVGGRRPRIISHQLMCEILEPRASETFGLIHEEVVRAGFERLLNAGVVLSGGGSLLPGVIEVAEQIFDLPVRPGQPAGAAGLTDTQWGPQHSTSIGLALFGARHQVPRRRQPAAMAANSLSRVGQRMRAWLAEIF